MRATTKMPKIGRPPLQSAIMSKKASVGARMSNRNGSVKNRLESKNGSMTRTRNMSKQFSQGEILDSYRTDAMNMTK